MMREWLRKYMAEDVAITWVVKGEAVVCVE